MKAIISNNIKCYLKNALFKFTIATKTVQNHILQNPNVNFSYSFICIIL